MAKAYLVEDDAALCRELARLLELQGYSCSCCEDFPRAAQHILAEEPDIVLLDLRLPGADGLAICRAVRERSSVPILILSSCDTEFDEVMGMNLGADDYVTKPYRPAVLVARMQALLRRADAMGGGRTRIAHAGVELDLSAGTVRYGDRSATLSRNEQRILALLVENPGVVITRQELMNELWETDAFIDDNTLTVNVNRVRRVLDSIGVPEGFLVTRRGVGYAVQ